MSGSLDAILGQEPAVQTLRRALRSGRAHHAYRFEGPTGVGKERTAFALAQALVCGSATAEGEGCTRCGHCRRAITLSEEEPHVPLHPDVVLVERGLYAPNLLGSSTAEARGISVAQIKRIVLSRAGYPPHEARSLVFIVRAADELTTSAANALLKTLEEPHAGVHFVLVTSRPNRLLDTIRSRTLPVRFGPLPVDALTQLLHARGLPTDAAHLGEGSAETALGLADVEMRQTRDAFVHGVRSACAASTVEPALALAAGKHERHDLIRRLGEFGQSLALEAREAHGASVAAGRAAQRHQLVTRAIDALEANAQPALALERLLLDLRRV